MSLLKEKLLSFNSKEEALTSLTRDLIDAIKEGLREKGVFSIILSGGNTPKVIYNELVSKYQNEIDWSKVEFIILDERYLAFESEESNSGNAYRRLISKVGFSKFLFPNTQLNLKDCAHNYNSQLSQYFKMLAQENRTIDLAILGTAPDGHVASIFPNIDITQKLEYVSYLHNDNLNQDRITLNMSAFLKSKKIIVIACGSTKADIVGSVILNRGHSTPIAQVNERHNNVVWYLDEEASIKLKNALPDQ